MTEEEKQAYNFFKKCNEKDLENFDYFSEPSKLQIKYMETVLNLIEKQQEEIEKKDKYINKLENKLMYALSPTTHELALSTQEHFKEIIRDNLEEDTYTIKRLLKEYWEDK